MANPTLARQVRNLFLCGIFILGTAATASAQPTLSKVFSPSTIGPGSVATITFTITNNSGSPVTGISFTDTLPVVPGPMTIADPSSAFTDCGLDPTTGSLSAPDGGSTITLTDAELGASSSCIVTVDVTASTPGTYTNPAITLSSSAGSSMSLPADLTVDTTLPGFSKSFAPSSVSFGGRSTLTFTIDNSANASGVPNLDFTDNLPTGVLIADPANASTTCGTATIPPTLTAAPGTDVIVLDADGTAGFPAVAAGAVCTVTVDVVTSAAGELDNVSDNLLAEFEFAGKASDTLESTVTPLAIRKTFTDDPTPPGGTVTLEFVIDNFDRDFPATGVGFTDDLGATLTGLTYTTLLANDCGGTVAGVGTDMIMFSGGTVAAEGSCTIRVSLSVPAGATPGSYPNTTSAVSGTVDGSPVVGNMASDTLFVEPVPVLTKEFLEAGTLAPDPVINAGDDVVIRFTITNTSATSGATDVEFIDELTDSGPGTGFLPFPVSVTLPPTPDPPCGGGSSLALVSLGTDRQGLELTGGSLATAGMAGDDCTFDVTVSTPAELGPGIKTNTTRPVTATVDGATRTGNTASDTLTVIAAPQLTKSFPDDPVAPGGTVTLEFTLEYPADASGDATDISFTDDLTFLSGLVATGLPIAAACDPDGPGGDPGTGTLSGSAGDTMLTFSGGTLMPGESCTFSVTLSVPAGAAPGDYTNTTSDVSATVDGLAATSPAASDVLDVTGLVFTKEFLGDPAIPGETVSLRFTIQNISPNATDDATDITFTDDLSDVLPGTPDLLPMLPATANTCGGTPSLIPPTFIFYTGGSLTIGSTCIVELDVLVPVGADDGDFNNVTGSLTATVDGSTVVVDPAVGVLTVNANLIQLDKTFTDDPVSPGDPVTLEFVLTNLDDTAAASSIDFTDDLGAALAGLTFDSVLFNDCGATVSGTGTDTITVTGGSLAAGGSCTIRVSLTVPGSADAGLYPNTTSDVSGMIDGLAVTGDPGTDELEVLQLLLFSKSFDGPTAATNTATLTFTITNPGADTAIGIDFTDDLDDVLSGLVATSLPAVPCGAGSSISGISFLTFSNGELPPMGGTCSFDVEVQVPASAAPGTYPNVTSDLTQSGLKVADPATADLVIEPPPTFAKVFAPDFIGLGQTSTLTFTIDNSGSAVAATSLDFTDNLPAGVAVATPSVTSNTCGGTLSATAGSSTISLSGGTVGAMATCTIEVDVVGTASGTWVNTTGDLTSSSGSSGTATDTLTVNPQPGFSKSFAPDPIAIGGVSTLTFTIDNTSSTVDATGLDFTDNLPAEIVVATPSNESTTCTGGTITAVDGSGTISYTGGSVPAGATCTVTVDTTSSTPGTHTNTSGDLTSSLGNSGTASDTLTVAPPPGFSKSFAPNPIATGGVSTLTFTIDNTGSALDATGLDFTDNLPAEIVVAAPANASTTCTGGTITAVPGSGTISYTGGTVTAGTSCTVSVDTTSAVEGSHTNTSGELTSSLGSSGPASDTLLVDPPPIFSKSFAPNPITAGDVSTLTFTINNSASAVPATALDFTDNLPAEVVIATPGNASTDCTGGTLSAPDGGDTISYSGGTVGAGTSCTVTVDTTSATEGSHTNTSGDLTSSAGNSGSASDTLVVEFAALAFSKSFAPAVIQPDEVSTLTFTIDNPTNASAVGGLDFTDNLPAGLVVASPPDASTTCMGGTLTAVAGSGTISYTGGTVPGMSSCTVTVDVTSSTPGAYMNVAGPLTSDAGSAGTASAELLVVAMFAVEKEFLTEPVLPGGEVELAFTITNASSTEMLTDIEFTDDLDAALPGLMTVAPVMESDVCGPGSELSGSSVLTFTGGSLAPGASCSFGVLLQVPADADPGSYENVTSTPTATAGGETVVTEPATADLVVAFLDFEKTFSPDTATGGTTVTLTFTISNPDPANSAEGITFSDDLDAFIPGAMAVGLPEDDVCGSGSTLEGDSLITLTGGTLGPGESCTFDVAVLIPGAAAGVFTNMTSILTAEVGGSAVAGDAASVATATLTVASSPIEIPTLGGWALIFFAGLLALLSVRRLSLERPRPRF